MTGKLRLATYNVEWFNNLFDRSAALLNDGAWSARWNVTRAQQIAALGLVFRAMDADAVMVIEAPDTSTRRSGAAALETFAAHAGLRARRALIGFANDTQQEIALLYDPDAVSARHAPRDDGPENPRFDTVFALDLDVDAAPETIRWSKPPLEVALTPKAGDPVTLIGVHAKSKSPHAARDASEIMRVSIENRRKQLAQCIWLRRRVEACLDDAQPLIVLGDFNDGPGLDEYEKLFGRSGVEIVMGEGDGTRLHDPHANLARDGALDAPTSARFRQNGGLYLELLLDYIMVSPDLAARDPHWQLWHPDDHPDCRGDALLREALLTASDHFPVTLDLSL